MKQVNVNYENFHLIGRKLTVDKITTTFNVKRDFNEKTQTSLISEKNQIDQFIEKLTFNLIKVSKEELDDIRYNQIPSFVLKDGNNLYYTEIPNDINFMYFTELGRHQCAVIGRECRRLSAASDAEGGCEKVREFAQYIEKYPWITYGFETFNTKHDSFVVLNCLHYEKCPPRKERTLKEKEDSLFILAQFLWKGIGSPGEIPNHNRKKRKPLLD